MPSLTHEKSFGPPLPVLLVPVKVGMPVASRGTFQKSDLKKLPVREAYGFPFASSKYVPALIFSAPVPLLVCSLAIGRIVPSFVSSQEVEGSFCDAGGINCTKYDFCLSLFGWTAI